MKAKSAIKRVHFRLFLILYFVAALPNASHAYDATGMVVASQGTLPLILTVPHDGVESLDLVPVRTKGTVARDAGTRELTERIAAHLEKRIGQRPYIVIARFSRKYLDANRTEQDAMESPDALPAYRAYHDQIARFVADVKSRFPAGSLLIDVHGQSGEPGTTFRGTRAGLTTRSLLKRFGPAALQGKKSIIGGLAAKGYQVNPAIDAPSLEENRRYAGGHTVYTYGSNHANGIDAIQLEFGRRHRENPLLAHDLAEALIVFMREYGLVEQ